MTTTPNAWALLAWASWARPWPAKRTFNPGFRIKLHQKDLGLAMQGARELGLALPQTAGAAQLMQVCAANGMAELDHSALVKALELMGHHEVASA